MQSIERNGRFAIDTTFVLFFLAVDLGQAVLAPGLDTLVSLLTVGIVVVVPYYLRGDEERPEFGRWIAQRGVIAVFAVCLGILFGQSLGIVLPEVFRYLPMTLLIASGAMSCCLQWCAMIRFRLAR